MAGASGRWEGRCMNRFLLTALTSAALLVPASGALAAPGDLDTTFSGDGFDLIDFGQRDNGHGVAVQPDGKIVVLATADQNGQNDFVVTRRNPDGSPDNSFSGDGQITFGVRPDGTGNDLARAVALGPDGSIVVAGTTDASSAAGDFAVARLTPGGELDSTFNGNGRQTVNYGAADDAADVAVRGDGAVIVGGTARLGGDRDLAVARLTNTGQLDNTWSGDGRASADFGGGIGADDSLRGVALTPDGGVVAVGQFQFVANDTDTDIARFRADGQFETTGFADGGRLKLSLGRTDRPTDVAVQADGKIVMTIVDGSVDPLPSLVARLTPSGARDASFGDNGLARVPVAGGSIPIALGLTPSGRIIVTSRALAQPNPTNFLVAEL